VTGHGLDDSESIPDQDIDISFLLHHVHTGSTTSWSVERILGIHPGGKQPQGEVDSSLHLVLRCRMPGALPLYYTSI